MLFLLLLPLGEGWDEGGSKNKNNGLEFKSCPLPEGEGTKKKIFSVTSAKLPRPAIAPYLHPCRQLRPALPYLHTSMYSSVVNNVFTL